LKNNLCKVELLPPACVCNVVPSRNLLRGREKTSPGSERRFFLAQSCSARTRNNAASVLLKERSRSGLWKYRRRTGAEGYSVVPIRRCGSIDMDMVERKYNGGLPLHYVAALAGLVAAVCPMAVVTAFGAYRFPASWWVAGTLLVPASLAAVIANNPQQSWGFEGEPP
jgi:hypothetical protein